MSQPLTAQVDHENLLKALLEGENKCVDEYAESPSDVTYSSLLGSRLLLSLHFSDLAHTECSRRAKSLFILGNKNGKLLAMLVAEHRLNSAILVIKTTGGARLTNPRDIMKEFVRYYTVVYSPIPAYMTSSL